MPYGGPWTPSEIPVGEFDDTESETSADTTINQSATEKKVFSLLQGPVVRRAISTNPGFNFNPAFYISLFKSRFGIIFLILFRHLKLSDLK